MSRIEDTFRVMVWGGLCRSRLLVIAPQHLRAGSGACAGPSGLGVTGSRGRAQKGRQAVSATRRGQGCVGTAWM